MKKCIISPYSKKLSNGNRNSKNYPYWKELIKLLNKEYKVIQIGVDGEDRLSPDFCKNLSLKELGKLLKSSDLIISVDNFLPHLCHNIGVKCTVLWGKSDPKIFGYLDNLNILKGEDCLRTNQFDIWDNEPYDEEVFVKPEEVMKLIDR